ncbi:DUF4832 domain-containing protein [candidate division KSB1 bacterium]|nr:DUF4832 domain-containing protein [candidate division KSB1 bacterium]
MTITIYPQEYPRALRNPHKGFTNRGRWEDNEWATLMHSYIKWNDIERDSLDGIDEIKVWCEINWAGVEDKNIKVIPRVYLHWDGDLTYWPDDMETFDYTSEQFKRRLKKMIWKLGQCWDTDPRVAHIEMGMIGKWGEHHSPSPSKEVEQILGEEFRKAFPHKKVMVRHAGEFTTFKFGIYWDSWAHHNQMQSHGQSIYNLGDRWKNEIIGGETAYNWGDWKIQPGDDPNDTMIDPVHRNFLIYTIRWLHCTQLRWVADYDQNNAAAKAGGELVQKVFGYRYVIDEVTYPSRIDRDQEFTVSFTGRNTGSAPFYYDWPVELALLNESNTVIWSADFDSVDIRTWMPGDKWKRSDSLYTVPAAPFIAGGTFKISNELNPGIYKLALAVLDPAGRLPSLRFAIKNYAKGGRHPIGYIGFGADIHSAELDSTTFENPYNDRSLHYIFDPDVVGVSGKTDLLHPQEIRLSQNYPNPFNPTTHINYELDKSSEVRIDIYSVTGQRVRSLVNEKKAAGNYAVAWEGIDDSGHNVASGLYFYSLTVNGIIEIRKMILAK